MIFCHLHLRSTKTSTVAKNGDGVATPSRWMFPDSVQIAKKRKRCKASRRARETRAFEMWNPFQFREKV